MPTLHIDFETRSAADLKVTGVDFYSRHPSTIALCAAWVIGDHPENIQLWRHGDPIPAEWSQPNLTVCAHNVSFERAIWVNTLKLPWPDKWEDTMAFAAAANMPLSLDNVSRWLRLPELKDKDGRALMLKMCKANYEPKEGEFDRLCEYCRQDVVVELEVHRKLKNVMTDTEKKVFDLDQKINSNGIHVDVETVDAVLYMVDQEKDKLAAELIEMTDGVITTGTQTARILKWLNERGLTMASMDAEAVADALLNPNLTPQQKRMLEIRQNWSLGSIGKYKTMSVSNNEGVLRDLFVYCGGSQTGRWAGRQVQPHNLPRCSYSDTEIEVAIQMFRDHNREGIRWMFGDIFRCAKQLLRSMFLEPSGLIVSDFSQIEARVLAWLADQRDLMDDFKNARPIYEKMASKIYNVPLEKVTKQQRQVGKGVILGAGYGMGAKMFALTVKSYGVIASANEAKTMIDTYRSTYPKIVALWKTAQMAFVEAMSHHEPVQITSNLVVRQIAPRVLRLTLPSGRFLFWHSVKLTEGEYGPEIMYRSAAGNIVKTYGANIVENISQAVARDILAAAMLRLDAEGFDVCMHVHDEVVIRGVGDIDTTIVSEIMSDNPCWAFDLPIACETQYCPTKRYTK